MTRSRGLSSASRRRSRSRSAARQRSRSRAKSPTPAPQAERNTREMPWEKENKKQMGERNSGCSQDDIAHPFRRQVSVYKQLALQAIEADENSPTVKRGKKSRRTSSAADCDIDLATYARLCYWKSDRQEIEGPRFKGVSAPRKSSVLSPVAENPKATGKKRSKSMSPSAVRKVKKSPKKSPKKSSTKKRPKQPKNPSSVLVRQPTVEVSTPRSPTVQGPAPEPASKEATPEFAVDTKPVMEVHRPSMDKFRKFNLMKRRRSKSIAPQPISRSNSVKSSGEDVVVLEEIKAPLSQRHSKIVYDKEQTPEVFENFAEAQFDIKKAKLKKTRSGRKFQPRKAALSVHDNQTQLEEPEKEVVALASGEASVQQDKDALARGKSAVSIKAPKVEKVRLARSKSTTVLKEPIKAVEEPVKLAAEECSTQLAEPEKEVVRLSRSKATCVLKEPKKVVLEPVKLSVGKTTEVAVKGDKVKLVKSKATTVLKEPKKPVVEPVRLTLSENATELAEPVKEPAEIVKLHRSKFTTVLKQPKKVVPEPIKLALTESSTELKEPTKPVEEPVKLVRSKQAIRIKAPVKKVVKLVEAENEFTHITEKAKLSRACCGHAFEEKKVVSPKVHLVKDSQDITVVVEEEKLVASKTGVALREPTKPETKLVLSNTSRSVEQDNVTLELNNMSRDFAKDAVVVVENGLDIEEEYDWSYLKWYAGGIATHYLLSGNKRASVHHHHTRKPSGRKN
jgi:hypothetical protein